MDISSIENAKVGQEFPGPAVFPGIDDTRGVWHIKQVRTKPLYQVEAFLLWNNIKVGTYRIQPLGGTLHFRRKK